MSIPSTPMAPELARYKLETEFYGKTVVHTTIKSDLSSGLRKALFKTAWIDDGEMGSGAFGVVREEINAVTFDRRAVKVIAKRHFKNFRELETMAALQDHHELFVPFLGWFEDSLSIYIAMELQPDGDLSRYIRQNEAMAAAEAKEIASQLLEGLAVMHERGICHRDLKPQNILIARKNPIWVKISDFGISKRTTGTDLRTVCGTPCYKAPELQGLLPTGLGRREFYTNAVDLWALGAIIHLLLTAEIPFLHTFLDTDMTDITTTSDDQPELDMTLLCAYCNGTEAFPTDSLRKHQVCDDGIDLIKRLMAVNPENRVTAKTASRSPWLVGTDTPNLNPTTDNVTGSCPGLLQTEFRHLGVSLTEEDARQLYRTENKDTIKQILNYSKEDLWPPIAVTGGYMEVTKILLRLDVIGHHNLLVVAARAGRMAIIQFLLNHGCGQDDYHVGSNPLLEAVKGGHLDAITFLLSHGTESDWGVNDVHQFPALQIAALAGQVDAMELLLAAGADPTTPATQNGGLTALQAASSCGHMAAVNLLLSRRVIAPNEVPAQKCGRTAVQAAAGGGHVDVIKVLLKKKCRVNEPPAAIGGRTAFQAAAEGGHLEAMKFLQQNGADIHAAPCWEDGLTALQAAAGGGHLSVVKFLLKMGVNHHERPGFRGGRTALQAAASNGHCNVMKFLIENGAHHNQHLATENGMTALQAAVVGGHVKALRVLLNHGVFSINQPIEMEAKPFEKATSQSPLEFAVGQENLEMVRALLDGDALVDKQVLQKARKRGEKQGNNQMIFLLRQAMERSRLVSFLLLHGTLSDTPVNKAGLAKLVVVCSGI